MKTKNTALLISLLALGSLSASAQTVTFSGSELSDLRYKPDASYVAGTPDLAVLSTPDAGEAGVSPTVYVNAITGNAPGFTSLGTLSTLSASYDLYSGSLPDGTTPYFSTYVIDPITSGYIDILSLAGTPLNGSSTIHVVYANDPGALTSATYWGDTLSELDSTAYGSTTFGQMTVYEVGVEIGDWNISDSDSATANIDSITVSNGVPDPSTLPLVGIGLGVLAGLRRRLNRVA
jgi:hypothetical protein